MYCYVSQDYLMHHGVKGMKWGVRHDPELVGRQRRQRPSTSFYRTARQNAHNAYVNTYASSYKQNQGLSDKQARAKAERRLQIAKKVAIGSAVAVGLAGSVYFARTVGRTRNDELLKSGTTIQTVKKNASRVLSGDKFYTATRNSDKTKYIGYFGNTKNDGLKNKIEATVSKDVRIAGEKTGKKVFKDLLNNDSDFRHKFNLMSYKEFNKFELKGNTSSEGKRFIEKLNKMGYSGVADLNDRRLNFYHTKATIMFNNKNLTNIKVSEITKNEYHKSKGKALLMGGADILSTPASIALATGVAGSVALRRYDKKGANKNDRSSTKKKQ